MKFETLIYTDCRPGQGLGNGGGLQFQARSGPAAWAAASLVARSLLYEPPAQWMLDRRPAADYPLSLGHAWDGQLVTARGRYLGREANGSREGNQLTHALVTTDPDAYGLTRPAQLFGGSFWADRPAPTTTSEPVSIDEDLGAFGAEALRDFACADPDQLVALLSALDRLDGPDATRVVFVSADPEPVLRWIAAATLLIPQRRALAVGFKVFSTNPAYADQPVIAVHPEWAGPATRVGNDAGYTVFDLTSGAHSPVPAGATARAWVDLFGAADPYDVVDMVEVAGASGLPPDPALALAAAAVLGRAPAPEQVGTLVRWLADGPPSVIDSYGDAVVGPLVGSVTELPLRTLRALDAVTAEGRFPDRAGPVRAALVGAEISAAIGTTGVAPGRLDEVAGWTGMDEEYRSEAFRSALARASGHAFEALLRLAVRHGVPLSAAELGAPAGRFVAEWADHPDHPYEPAGWPGDGILVDLLRDELQDRLVRGAAHPDQIGDAWVGTLLEPAADPADPLHAALLSAAMIRAEASEVLTAQLGRAAGDADAFARAAEQLWRRRPASSAELRRLGAEAPVGARLTSFAVQDLVANARLADPGSLAICRLLIDRGLFRDPAIETLIRDDGFVTAVLPRLGVATPAELRERADRLGRVDLGVWYRHGPALVRALLATGPVGMALLIGGFPKDLRREVSELLADAVEDGKDGRLVAGAFAVYAKPGAPEEVRTLLAAPFQRWLTETKEKSFGQVAEYVAALRVLEPAYLAQWERFVELHQSLATAKKDNGSVVGRVLSRGRRPKRDR